MIDREIRRRAQRGSWQEERRGEPGKSKGCRLRTIELVTRYLYLCLVYRTTCFASHRPITYISDSAEQQTCCASYMYVLRTPCYGNAVEAGPPGRYLSSSLLANGGDAGASFIVSDDARR